MLTQEEIDNNKEKFIALLRTITRKGADIESLINKLQHTDFFTAPASTHYHCSYEGGLCKHCLNVYNNLTMLIKAKCPELDIEQGKDSAIIVSLLHDISKMNFYETSTRNVKDKNGEWIKVPYIKLRETANRFVYSTHGVNSEFMVRQFIPLTLDESVAIINHMGGKEYDGPGRITDTLSEVFSGFPLAILLHTADMLATFYDER